MTRADRLSVAAVTLLVVLVAGCGRSTDSAGPCVVAGSSTWTMRAPSTAETPDRVPRAVSQPAMATNESVAIQGAVSTAVRFVASTDQLMAHSPIGRRVILEQLVAPLELDRLAEQFDAAADGLQDRLKEPVSMLLWVEAPAATAVVAATNNNVTVAVWSVSIMALPRSAPQEVWRTITVDLTATEAGWRVVDSNAVTGPTPLQADLALPAGWDEFAHVAAWAPVTAGASLEGG